MRCLGAREAAVPVKELDTHGLSSIAEQDVNRKRGSALHPIVFGLILIAFAAFQTVSYTAFRLAEFDGFSIDSIAPLLKDVYFWIGVASSFGILVITFTLVRVSESSLVLVMSLYLASILVGFLLLPLTWKAVFHEEIFSSYERVGAFGLALTAAVLLLAAKYLWDRGG